MNLFIFQFKLIVIHLQKIKTKYMTDIDSMIVFRKKELKAIIKSFRIERLASLLDVTYLKDDSTDEKIKELAQTAISHKCASVCVYPKYADNLLPSLLKGTNIKECYVIDFPLGKSDIKAKAELTSQTLKKSIESRGEGSGKVEFDMVIDINKFKKDSNYTLQEINAVCDAADGETVKVIVRSPELTVEEIKIVTEIVLKSDAHFIKNSTGMDTFGATPEHINMMREIIGTNKGVKAAGGIKTADNAMRLVYAGAFNSYLQNKDLFRIGTSSPVEILSGLKALKATYGV